MPPRSKKRPATGQTTVASNEDELWNGAYRSFQLGFPDAPASEFWQYIYDTAEAYGVSASDNMEMFMHHDHNDHATFNVQVDYVDTDAINVLGRDCLVGVAELAGFHCVDRAGSRAAFKYAPTRWVDFLTLMRKAALTNCIAIKRIFFAFSSVGLTFGFPDEEVEDENSSIDTLQLKGDDLSEEEKLALCMRKGLEEKDAKAFLAQLLECDGSVSSGVSQSHIRPKAETKKAKRRHR